MCCDIKSKAKSDTTKLFYCKTFRVKSETELAITKEVFVYTINLKNGREPDKTPLAYYPARG